MPGCAPMRQAREGGLGGGNWTVTAPPSTCQPFPSHHSSWGNSCMSPAAHPGWELLAPARQSPCGSARAGRAGQVGTHHGSLHQNGSWAVGTSLCSAALAEEGCCGWVSKSLAPRAGVAPAASHHCPRGRQGEEEGDPRRGARVPTSGWGRAPGGRWRWCWGPRLPWHCLARAAATTWPARRGRGGAERSRAGAARVGGRRARTAAALPLLTAAGGSGQEPAASEGSGYPRHTKKITSHAWRRVPRPSDRREWKEAGFRTAKGTQAGAVLGWRQKESKV